MGERVGGILDFRSKILDFGNLWRILVGKGRANWLGRFGMELLPGQKGCAPLWLGGAGSGSGDEDVGVGSGEA